MKKENTLLTIKRLDSSPYWSSHFTLSEKENFEKLKCNYLNSNETGFFDVAITNTHSDLNRLTPETLSDLKLIIHLNSGYDNFSPEILDKISAPVILGNELRAHAVAETILAEIFSKFSLAPNQEIWQKDRKWLRALLSEQNILIIGLGMIGTIVKNTLNALGAKIFFFDPYKNFELMPANKIDLIILTASLNPSSFEIVNADLLKSLSSTGMLINCARGELVHMPSLLEFLANNPLSSAYLDVFPNEPTEFSEFKLQNLKTSSHISGVHYTLENKTLAFSEKVVSDFLDLDQNDFQARYRHINLHNRKFKNFLI